jgi:hypothetical protein
MDKGLDLNAAIDGMIADEQRSVREL